MSKKFKKLSDYSDTLNRTSYASGLDTISAWGYRTLSTLHTLSIFQTLVDSIWYFYPQQKCITLINLYIIVLQIVLDKSYLTAFLSWILHFCTSYQTRFRETPRNITCRSSIAIPFATSNGLWTANTLALFIPFTYKWYITPKCFHLW